MDIEQWQKEFIEAHEKRFTGSKWTAQDRLISLIAQAAEVGEAIQSRQGLKSAKGSKSVQHLITSIFPDLFLLCDMLNVNLNKELTEALGWWQHSKAVR